MAQRRSFLKHIKSSDGPNQLTMVKAFFQHAETGLYSLTLKVGSGRFPAGHIWPVRLEQREVIDPDHPLANVFTDGWRQLYEDLNLRLKDVIIFEKVARWEFEITVFSKAYTLKRPNEAMFENFEPDDSSSDEDVNPHRATQIDLTENMSSRICVNREFILANDLDLYETVILVDDNLRDWPCNLDCKETRGNNDRYYIGRGWNDYWRYWNLHGGKVVIIEYRVNNKLGITIHDPADFESESEEGSH